jgi:diacylglycerol kinase (ATP)
MKSKGGKFSFPERLQSLGYALQGLKELIRNEHNAWIHVSAAIAVIAAGLLLEITSSEWCWILLAIALVFITEIINTAIEALCDHLVQEHNPVIGKVKDLSAAAVLIAALFAAGIGLFVFIPYFI